MVNKLRAAIEAKFEELSVESDVYIDEELPDLVVMMVNLKRSIAYMAHRLVFFLGIDTEEFMEWLQGLLEASDPLEPQSDCSSLEEELCKLEDSDPLDLTAHMTEQVHLLSPTSLENVSASLELPPSPLLGSEDGSMFQLPLYKEDPAVVDWSVQASMGSDDLRRLDRLDRLEPFDLSPPSELSMTAECQVRLIQKLQGQGPRSEGFPVEQIPAMCSYFLQCPQIDFPVYHPQHCHFAADHLTAQYSFNYPDHLWAPETQYSSRPQSLSL